MASKALFVLIVHLWCCNKCKRVWLFNPGVNGEENYDLGLDFGIGRKQVSNCDEQINGEMLGSEYRELVQSLNQKQNFFTMFSI